MYKTDDLRVTSCQATQDTTVDQPSQTDPHLIYA